MSYYITSVILLLLSFVFSFMRSLWSGFTYCFFAVSSALCILWIVIWISDFFTYYSRKGLDERYKVYCAELVNKSALTLDIIQKKDKLYFKRFQRSLLKEKMLAWVKILLVIGVLIAICATSL